MTTKTKEAVAAALAGSNGFSLISNEKLLQLYATMVKCRMIAEQAQVLLGQNSLISNFDATVSQEALAVGIALDLLPEDTIAPSQRDVIVDYIKGIPLEKIFGTLLARAAPPNLDAQLNFVLGAALGNKMKKNGGIAVAFCGDGSASRSLWHDALCIAGAQQLPILFVCQNNPLTGPARHQKQTSIEGIALKAETCGFPALAVDGNDVVAVYRVATESIAHARKGNGPTLIECKVKRSKAHDPIRKMETYLMRKGLFNREMKLEVITDFTKHLDAAIEAVRRSPFPE
jgi:TPP-dependent pyruvate/acetoin dehydrogenase alpha subunit